MLASWIVLGVFVLVVVNGIYLETFSSLLKNVFLSHIPTSRYKQKIVSLKTIKIILVKEKNVSVRSEPSMLSIEPAVYRFTAKGAGGMSTTSDGNRFECPTGKPSRKILGSSKCWGPETIFRCRKCLFCAESVPLTSSVRPQDSLWLHWEFLLSGPLMYPSEGARLVWFQ